MGEARKYNFTCLNYKSLETRSADQRAKSKFVSKLEKQKNKLLKLALIVSKARRKINQEKWRISTTRPKLDNKTSSLSFSPPNRSEKVIRTKSVIKYPMPSSMPTSNKIPTPKATRSLTSDTTTPPRDSTTRPATSSSPSNNSPRTSLKACTSVVMRMRPEPEIKDSCSATRPTRQRKPCLSPSSSPTSSIKEWPTSDVTEPASGSDPTLRLRSRASTRSKTALASLSACTRSSSPSSTTSTSSWRTCARS